VAGQVASKVKNFLWLMYQNRIQTTDNLIKKQWKGSKFCKFVTPRKQLIIYFFQYPSSIFIWSVIKDALNWTKIPKSWKDFNDNFLLERGHKMNSVILFLLGTVCWTLWLNRNDWVFRE
jgi:hypothetical protein